MGYHFNPPPGWPTPPPGWQPPKGWQPDPSWPPPPAGWDFWLPDAPTARRPQAPPEPALDLPTRPETASPAGAGLLGGLFGSKKRQQTEAENQQLRQWIARFDGLDAVQIAAETSQLRQELHAVRGQLAAAQADLAGARTQIVLTEETALLQEVGVYEYQHPLADAVAYKAKLTDLKDKVKAMTRDRKAVLSTTDWQVNGSAKDGKKMVADFSKLMLRAYNAEADNCVRTVRPHTLHSATDRLDKVRDTIARLGKTMSIRISDPYHNLRVRELKLTADHLAKVEEEKERVRAERERQRDEAAAQREFEREKARLAKEQAHYTAALAKLQAKGDQAGAAELEAKLTEITDAISGVDAREANLRAGYVYIISNLGAFGERMVKIGMTRRLEPTDRIRELGDASVPFRFDTHALIFSEDAVGLESRLHTGLADRRVNRVNTQREFFYATPAEVRAVLERIAGQHLLEYHETAEALEWRASQQPTEAN